MIKAQELRIGNIISSQSNLHKQVTVLQLFSDSYQADFGNGNRGAMMYSTSDGIPLTSEWLYRLGLYWDIYWQGITDGNWVLTEGNENGTWRIAYGKTRHDIIVWNIKYVHQLQNLYQCLSGKELQLKD